MQMIINKQDRFYDYFPHVPLMWLKKEFNMGYFEQSEIRTHIQNIIGAAYKRLLDKHDLFHVNVYFEIGEEFDENFYRELKEAVTLRFHDITTWKFLDSLLHFQEIEDEKLNANFQTKIQTILESEMPRSQSTNRINLRNTLIALLNYDLELLSGQELLYLTKIN